MPRPPFVSRLGERFRLGRPLASGARGFATLAAGLRFRQRRRPSPTIMYLAGDRLSITMADYPAKLSEADGGSFQTSGNFGAPIVTQPEQPPRPTWGGGRAPSDAVDLLLAFADLFVLNDVITGACPLAARHLHLGQRSGVERIVLQPLASGGLHPTCGRALGSAADDLSNFWTVLQPAPCRLHPLDARGSSVRTFFFV